MALKRTYQVSSKYVPAKRQRTLTQEVEQLKKKVAVNKKELKYYDASFTTGITNLVNNQSIFTDVPDVAFIGRKLHVMKIEFKLADFESVNQTIEDMSLWREIRPGKFITPSLTWLLAFDPEYHTHLRHWNAKWDVNKSQPEFVIGFGKLGRLVEFDNQVNGVASGDITTGDIKCNISTSAPNRKVAEFRVWYTDS